HLVVVNFQSCFVKSVIEGKVFQQSIALAQYFLILNELFQIQTVLLCDNVVEKTPAGFTAFRDQILVGRRNNNNRNQTYVFRQFFIGFAIAFQNLFLSFL